MTNFDYCSQKLEKYIVQPGDNLVKITKKLDIPLRKIMLANPYINPYLLVAGQMINIPIEYMRKPLKNSYSDENLEKSKLYFTKQGDTIDSIAKQFKISKEEIINLNRNNKLNNVSAGQKIKIPFESDRFHEAIGEIYAPLIRSSPIDCRRLIKSQVIAIKKDNEGALYLNSINNNTKKIMDFMGISYNDLVKVTYSHDIIGSFKSTPIYTLVDIYCLKRKASKYV